MIVKTAPAKINLSLHVTGKQPNGYHELSSIVVFTEKGDEISLNPSDSYKLTVSGPFAAELNDPSSNLITHAIFKASEYLRKTPNIHIHLVKNLPISSGIGGGTSDAATALKLLFDYWHINPEKSRFVDVLPSLGADMPVCFSQKPCLMSGIGERLTPFNLSFPLPLLLINPLKKLATPDVFRARKHAFNTPCPLPKAKDLASFIQEIRFLTNDLEMSAISLCPEMKDILSTLAQQKGCKIARMSGSGATCFGLFESEDCLDDARMAFQNAFPDYWVSVL